VVKNGQIFTSTNAGVTWAPGSSPVQRWIAVASSGDGTRLAAVIDGLGAGQIYTLEPPVIAPLLGIQLTDPATLTLSWPSSSPGFALQGNDDLRTTNWTNTGLMPADDGTNLTVTVSPSAASQFYRLMK
jgi:hypothetical protein